MIYMCACMKLIWLKCRQIHRAMFTTPNRHTLLFMFCLVHFQYPTKHSIPLLPWNFCSLLHITQILIANHIHMHNRTIDAIVVKVHMDPITVLAFVCLHTHTQHIPCWTVYLSLVVVSTELWGEVSSNKKSDWGTCGSLDAIAAYVTLVLSYKIWISKPSYSLSMVVVYSLFNNKPAPTNPI